MAKIVGNPTVTPVMPSDWAQKDETKVDYIKNKPTKLSQFENDVEFVDNDTYVTDMEVIDGWLSQNDDNIAEHKIDYSNPHNVTADQVGTYTAVEIDALIARAGGNVDLSGYYTKGEIDAFRIEDEMNMERHVGLRINESLGDISSALDTILTIQETLVGGVD